MRTRKGPGLGTAMEGGLGGAEGGTKASGPREVERVTNKSSHGFFLQSRCEKGDSGTREVEAGVDARMSVEVKKPDVVCSE